MQEPLFDVLLRSDSWVLVKAIGASIIIIIACLIDSVIDVYILFKIEGL